MTSVNFIIIAGTISGQVYENATQSGQRNLKRQLIISNYSYRYSGNEDSVSVTLDCWKKAIQDLVRELPEGTPVVVEGSFHAYQHQTGEGKKTTYSISADKVHIFPEGIDPLDMKFNTINLIGRVSFGRNSSCDMRFFESGSAVANFSLAVERPSRNSDPDWFNISAWNQDGDDNGLASRASNYLEKGRLISVQGQLTFSKFTSKQTGETVTKFEVRISGFQFLGGKKDSQPTSQSTDQSQQLEIEHTPPEDCPPVTSTPSTEPVPVKPVTSTPSSSTNGGKKKGGSKTPAGVAPNLDDVPF